MTRYSVLALAGAGALLLGGCTTHLESVKSDTSTASRMGAPYMLRFTQYKIVLTRRVTDCGSRLKLVNKAEVTSELVDDGDHSYVVKLNSLNSPLKISDLKVQYTDGRFVAINVSTEDRTAQTVLAAAQGIGKIAVAATTGAAVGSEGSVERCTPEVIAQLKAKQLADTDIAREKAEVDRLKSEVSRHTAAFAASQNSDAQRPALTSAVNLLDAATIRLGDAEARLKTALAFLSDETKITWPKTSLILHDDKPVELSAQSIAKWWEITKGDSETDPEWQDRKKLRYEEIAQPLKVWFAIDRVGSYGRDPVSQAPTDDAGPEAGIRFRLPASGRLIVCQKAACTRTGNDDVVAEFAGPVQQLGHIYYASYSSPPMSSGAFEFSQDDQGRPKTIGVSRKTASAETAADLFRDGAGEFSKAYAEIYKTPAEKAAEELATLEMAKKIADARAAADPNSSAAQLAALEMQKKLADARAALETAPTYELARLTAIAEAQKKYQDALRALEPAAGADQAAQRAAIDAETALLKSEAARIEAQILLRDARARLGQ